MSDSKPTNPKDGIGVTKVPLHLVSGLVKAYQSVAHYLGNVKYGAWNYLACGARASVYVSALYRHIDRWWSGEELDPVDGTPHLANALACLNIIIETKHRGNLIDDRPPATELGPVYSELERMMENIRERYKDRNPRHYTIQDSEPRQDKVEAIKKLFAHASILPGADVVPAEPHGCPWCLANRGEPHAVMCPDATLALVNPADQSSNASAKG